MQDKVPPLWKIVLPLISIPVGWFVIWFLLALIAHFFGIPFPSVSDMSGLLSTIGSIMGAIFTVGGLVVALVAVLTQIQLQDRIKREVSNARQEVEDTFNNELRVEYEKRIREQVEGMLAFFQAANAADWKRAEELIRIALQKYPELPRARSFLGFRMSNDVQAYFYYLLRGGLPQLPQRFLYPVDDASMYYTSESATQLSQPWMEPPKLDAIDWLQQALQHQDDPEGEVSAALALMYGFSEAYGKMIEALHNALDHYPDLVSYFQSPGRLMMLIYACSKDRARIQELMNVLHFPLPTENDVQTVLSKPATMGSELFVDWYAVESQIGGNTSKLPATIRIYRPSIHEPVRETYAQIFRQGQQSYSFPRADFSRDPSQGVAMLPINELLKQLFGEFLFLCPTQGELFSMLLKDKAESPIFVK